MQESLAPEHGRELLGDALEQFLNGGGVADYGCGHLQSANGDVAERGLDVVRDPLGEVGRISVLEEQGGINYFRNMVGSAISQNTEPRIDYILWIKYFSNLDKLHLLINFLHGQTTSEDGGGRQVSVKKTSITY